MRAYNQRLQAALERTVWARTDKSWYKRADGRITNNWSGPTIAYWWRTRRADLRLYHQAARSGADDAAWRERAGQSASVTAAQRRKGPKGVSLSKV